MADHGYQSEGGAALAAVKQRQARIEAEEGHRRTQRRAHLQRVDGGRLAGVEEFDAHGTISPSTLGLAPTLGLASHGAGLRTAAHTGFVSSR